MEIRAKRKIFSFFILVVAALMIYYGSLIANDRIIGVRFAIWGSFAVYLSIATYRGFINKKKIIGRAILYFLAADIIFMLMVLKGGAFSSFRSFEPIGFNLLLGALVAYQMSKTRTEEKQNKINN